MTPQQAEVADAIVAGVPRGDLARFLGITREAVDGRLHHLRRDLGARDYAALVVALKKHRPSAAVTITAARKRPRKWFEV
jgi:DNA-binding CsgD family transcriptional regulator